MAAVAMLYAWVWRGDVWCAVAGGSQCWILSTDGVVSSWRCEQLPPRSCGAGSAHAQHQHGAFDTVDQENATLIQTQSWIATPSIAADRSVFLVGLNIFGLRVVDALLVSGVVAIFRVKTLH